MKPEQAFGLQILGGVMSALGKDWDDVSDEHRKNASEIAMDYGALVLRATFGEDVEKELSEVRAAIKQWTWIGEDVARRAMLDAAELGLELGVKAALTATGL